MLQPLNRAELSPHENVAGIARSGGGSGERGAGAAAASAGGTSGPAPRQPAIDAAIAAGSFEVIGTEQRGGEQVYRLAARPDVPLEPADVGTPVASISRI